MVISLSFSFSFTLFLLKNFQFFSFSCVSSNEYVYILSIYLCICLPCSLSLLLGVGVGVCLSWSALHKIVRTLYTIHVFANGVITDMNHPPQNERPECCRSYEKSVFYLYSLGIILNKASVVLLKFERVNLFLYSQLKVRRGTLINNLVSISLTPLTNRSLLIPSPLLRCMSS